MPFTNVGAELAILRLGSDLPGEFIGALGIGSGSGTALITNTVLLNERNRTIITGTPDFSEARKVGFQADFNAVTMSGTDSFVSEFSLFKSGPILIGSAYFRDAFGSIAFDGTNELQVVVTLEGLAGS